MKVAVVQLSSAAPRVRVLDRARVVKAGDVKAPDVESPLHRAGAPARPGRGGLLLLACLGVFACRSGDVTEPAPAPVAAAGGAAAQARAHAAAKANDGYRPKASEPWHIPVGPKLAIVPGSGFGPIRFGAHLDTIERLIGE